jgi:hypothetical protein
MRLTARHSRSHLHFKLLSAIGQAPNPKLQTNVNHPSSKLQRARFLWTLKFVIWNFPGLGIWNFFLQSL